MPSVYFLIMYDPAEPAHDFCLVKVGVTDGDVADRIATLQTGNPYELRCVAEIKTPYAQDLEYFVHRTHTTERHHLEWFRRSRGSVAALVDEAKQAARSIERDKSKEDLLVSRVSNGKERRPERKEIELHREGQEVKKNLVLAELHLEAATSRLHAATGTTQGIPGIIRVTRVAPQKRFNPRQATQDFPELAERCRVEKLKGTFHWRDVPKPRDFVAEKQAAEEAAIAAEEAKADFFSKNTELNGWTLRTTELERVHDEYLRATQLVAHLGANLRSLERDLTLKMDEDNGLIGVCSYARFIRSEVDTTAFRQLYPQEAAQCVTTLAANLKKSVYRTRSYWSGPASSAQERIADRPT